MKQEDTMLVSASFGRRAAAKISDGIIGMAVAAPLAWLAWRAFGPLFVIALPVLVLGFLGYLILSEYCFGQTLGKRLLGLRVVNEAGARVSLGQAVVRQLPLLLNLPWVDVFFALFTDKHQRAFELLSRTRVVLT
jgi:uncharacterized RDD family membrane protein YckC